MSRRHRFTRNLGRRVPAATPQREELRYVRFENATEIIRGVTYGPFSYVADARNILIGCDRAELDDVMQWFNDNLEEPERMVPFREVGERRARRRKREAMAQCWFRDDAEAHIARARELVAILERAGFGFVERWSDRLPGKLCAADGFQIAVVPYRDTDDRSATSNARSLRESPQRL
jgi:hypothetical protein